MRNQAPSPSQDHTKSSWIGLIDESVHTSDDIDIGDIDAVSRDFVVVKRGFVNVHYYYIPISKVEGWDSNVLWLKVTEDEIKRNYEREKAPHPSRYYVKDHPHYTTIYYPEVTIIPSRSKKPAFTIPPPSRNAPEASSDVNICDLCNTSFRTEDELSEHIRLQHY